MASSDNVVRAGFTPKFKDVSTLTSMLTYNYAPISEQKMDPAGRGLPPGAGAGSTRVDWIPRLENLLPGKCLGRLPKGLFDALPRLLHRIVGGPVTQRQSRLPTGSEHNHASRACRDSPQARN